MPLSFRDLSIQTKVMAAFVAVFLTTLALGLFSLSETASVNDKALDVRDNWLPSTVALGDLEGAVVAVQAREAEFLVAAADKTPGRLAAAAQAFQDAVAAADKAYAAYAPLITAGTRDEALMKTFVASWATAKLSTHTLLQGVAAIGGGTPRLGEAVSRALDSAIAAVRDDLHFNAAEGRKAADAGEATYASSRLLVIGAIAAAALLCVLTGLSLIVTVAVPLKHCIAAVEHLAGRPAGCGDRQQRQAG